MPSPMVAALYAVLLSKRDTATIFFKTGAALICGDAATMAANNASARMFRRFIGFIMFYFVGWLVVCFYGYGKKWMIYGYFSSSFFSCMRVRHQGVFWISMRASTPLTRAALMDKPSCTSTFFDQDT